MGRLAGGNGRSWETGTFHPDLGIFCADGSSGDRRHGTRNRGKMLLGNSPEDDMNLTNPTQNMPSARNILGTLMLLALAAFRFTFWTGNGPCL